MVYNKCLTSTGYDNLSEASDVLRFFSKSKIYRYEHEHRKWEYGLVLNFFKNHRVDSILNVGGGNSPLSTMLLDYCDDVVEIDPNFPSVGLPNIKYIVDSFPSENLSRVFDAVVCTSVIEHVEDDMPFFSALLKHSSKYLFLTTDFHPSGNAFSISHYRTYNKRDIQKLIDIAKDAGFYPVGTLNYSYESPMVYDYTFASLVLGKK